tara:strand:+ start:445 stop:1521 length:1077 start_codon:yes stop_codon:yes gene_type:complete
LKFKERLNQIVSRHKELANLMSYGEGLGSEDYVKMSKEFAELDTIAACVEELREGQGELEDLNEIVSDPEMDQEMKKMAEEEIIKVTKIIADTEQKLKLLLLPKDIADQKNAILEIRAGTGGDEAALFAGDLLRMYQKFCDKNRWKFEIMSLSETDIGGIKEGQIEITGKGVFARLKYESGVHRVQRVPETESGGRIHTSAATVAVLPEAEEVDVQIDEKDLRIDTFRAQGAGGQHVNTTDSAVRITHIPTGIVVQQQDEKSQHKNRAKALKILRARIFDYERQIQVESRAQDRRNQVGSGDRSERIRTYNYPQGRVTDHRINVTLHKLDKVLEGEALDEIVEALVAEDQARKLTASI